MEVSTKMKKKIILIAILLPFQLYIFFVKTKYSSLHNYKDYNKLHPKCPLQKTIFRLSCGGVGTIKLFTSFNFICFNSKKFVDFRGLLFFWGDFLCKL